MRRTHRLLALAALLAAPAVAPTLPASRTVAAPAAQPGPPTTYRLAETWADVPWAPTAGRYGEALDISSAPDGRAFVLDGRHDAVHVLAPDGRPMAVFAAGDGGSFRPQRLDVGADGRLLVLSTASRDISRVDRLEPSGTQVDGFEIGDAYADIAVRGDGRIYLARSVDSATGAAPAVDVFSADGSFLESIAPPELVVPLRVDVADDGAPYVLHDVPIPSPPRQRPPPGPRATQAPSAVRPAQASPDPVPGVLLFTPDHVYIETVAFDFGLDVAVGPAGAFVARYGAVFALGETEPLRPLRGQRWSGSISLDVPPDGRVLASLSHCSFQGVLVVDDPAARPAPMHVEGALDAPELEGPVYPLRVAAGAEAVVLQGRYTIDGGRPTQSYRAYAREGQTAQRWTARGDLASQLGICAGREQREWARDVALDGDTVYTVDATCLTRRPDDHFPEWTTCLGGLWGTDAEPHVVAVAAEEGRVAVLDGGAGRVVLTDAAGTITGSWPVHAGHTTSPPVDIAMGGDRVFLADRGRSSVLVRTVDGADRGEWPAHDVPQRIAVGPDGGVFVLGRGGWALRYGTGGLLEAAWRLPDSDVTAVDIAPLDDGRVVVGFVDHDPADFFGNLGRAGLWVFAPDAAASPEPPVGAAACTARPDKRATPDLLPLGDVVTVTLAVEGGCPGIREPVQLAIVFDTSRSMGWGSALTHAKDAVLALLRELDPRITEVALVSFGDSAALREPLTRDLVGLSARVTTLRAAGDTRMGEGLALAHQHLVGPGRDPDAHQLVVIVSDGVPKDATRAALDAALRDGVEVYALLFEDGQAADGVFVDEVTARGGTVLFQPAEAEMAAFARDLVRQRPETGLFAAISIVDRVPANMRYVAGSARPPAAFDAAANSLTWSLTAVSAATTLELSYRLKPLEVGTWPTNVEAVADYRDAHGADGRLVFPVPAVTVYTGAPFVAYLPYAARTHCVRRARPVDVVLVLDTSVSMADTAAGGGTKLDAARAAAGAFVGLLHLPDDHAAVVAFSGTGRRLTDLTGDAGALARALAGLASTPGTRIDLGLAEARAALTAGARPAARPVVVLLTDGRQNGAADPVLEVADELRADGARVFTIGLGADVDRDLLRTVASEPGDYFESPTEAELAAIYGRISERLACEPE